MSERTTTTTTTVGAGSSRGGYRYRIARMLPTAVVALVLGATGVAATTGPSPAGAALPPAPPGCPFVLTSGGYQGAAGSEYLVGMATPTSPVERCTTTVGAAASLSSDDGTPFTNVADNPVGQPVTLTFEPARRSPIVLLRYTFHCADPAGPGTLHLTVAGQTIDRPVAAQSCNGQAGAGLGISLEPVTSEVSLAGTPDGGGYVGTDDQGDVFLEGDAGPAPTVFDPTGTAVAVDPAGAGYWVAGSDGSVYSYGTAAFHGSAYPAHPVLPVVGVAATPDGGGYWLVASDGGVFAFGDAGFYGSMGGHPLNAPVVGMAASPDGRGYWLVAEDGGVFAFGDASFGGSAGSLLLRSPMAGMAADPHGGYWLVAADGGVFAYGGAGFFGSAATLALVAPVSAVAAAPDGGGYALLGTDGGIFAYGSARYVGSPNA